jgi:hypothetical protein
LDVVFKTLAAKIVDSTQIGRVITGKPHEVNVFLQSFLYLTAGVNVTQIAAGATAFMLTQKKINVQIINDLIDKTYRMIRRYLFR